jgi:hypothetical protein
MNSKKILSQCGRLISIVIEAASHLILTRRLNSYWGSNLPIAAGDGDAVLKDHHSSSSAVSEIVSMRPM